MFLRSVAVFVAALCIFIPGGIAWGEEKPRGGGAAEISSDLDKGEGSLVQKGKATWYGKMFHGRETTSGEVYDMNGMTAAHRTLPFGTYVRVTNPANGRDVILRINDRGPFANDSIIDISYAAAQNLGIVHKGPVLVQIEALGYKKRDGDVTSYQPVDFDTGKFIILLGLFSEYEAAQRLAEELKQISQFAGIKKLKRKNGTFYRVFAGTYSSLKKAEAARARFEQEGYKKSLVVASF